MPRLVEFLVCANCLAVGHPISGLIAQQRLALNSVGIAHLTPLMLWSFTFTGVLLRGARSLCLHCAALDACERAIVQLLDRLLGNVDLRLRHAR